MIASSSFLSSLQHLIGFGIVLAALLVLWLITAGMGKIFQSMGLEAAGEATPPAARNGGADEPGDEEVAAIAACVAALIGPRSRIVSIRRQRKTDWNREGRREIFSSRNIR